MAPATTAPAPEQMRDHARDLWEGDRERRWTPSNRRFVVQGFYLPEYIRQPRLDIAVAIDTSGSTRRYLK